MSKWLDLSNNANNLKQSYVHGFVDISGGGINLRNDNSLNIYLPEPSNNLAFSIKSQEFTVFDESENVLVDVSNAKLQYIKNVSSDIEARLNSISGNTQFFTANQQNEIETSRTIVPSTANNIDLGSLTKPFSSLHVNSNSIFFVDKNNAANVVKMSVANDGTIDISSNSVTSIKKMVTSANNVTEIGTGPENPTHTLDVTGNAIFRNDVKINSNLTVDGSINFLGEFIQTNTNIQISEQMDLSNSGTGPALIVRQFGDKDIATFYDDASMVMVIKDGGDVSFNNSLIVNEDISCNRNLATGGTITHHGKLISHGDVSLNNDLIVNGDVSLNRGLFVNGDLSVNGFITGRYAENSVPAAAIDGFVAGSGGSITIASIDAGNNISNEIANISKLCFDSDSGFAVDDLSSGTVKVKMNSTFKTWKVDGESDLIAEGLDALHISSDDTINITTKTSSNLTYYVRANSPPTLAPYFLFSHSPNGPALNIGRLLQLEKGYTFTFIRTDNNTSNPFHIGSTWKNNDTGITITSTGTGPAPAGGHPDDNGVNSIDENGEQLSLTIPSDYNSTLSYYNFLNNATVTGFSLIEPVNTSGKKRIHFQVPGVFNITTDQNVGGKKTFTDTTTFQQDVSMVSNLVVNGTTELKSFLTAKNNSTFEGTVSVKNKLDIDDDVSANYNLYVGGSTNLLDAVTIYGQSFIYGDVSLNGKLIAHNDLSLNGNLFLNGAQTLNSNLIVGKQIAVDGDASFNGNAMINGDASLNSNLMVNGDVSFNNKLFVNGDSSFNSNVMVDGDVSFNNKLFVNGDVSMNSLLMIDGDVSLNSKLFVKGDVSLNSNVHIGQRTNIDGSLNVTGDIVAEDDLTVTNYSYLNNVDITGITMSTGDVSFNEKLFVKKDVLLNSNVQIGERTNIDGSLNVTGDIVAEDDLTVTNYSYLNNVDITGITMSTGDVSFNEKLFVNKDVSLNSNVRIGKVLRVDGDASLNSNLYLTGTANLKSFLNVENNTTLNGTLNVKQLVDLDNILNVDGDASFNSELHVEKDVSFNAHLRVGKQTIIDGSLQVIDNITATDISGNKLDMDHIIVGGGARKSSAYLSNDDAAVTVNGHIQTKALLNYGETDTSGTGVVFGNGATLTNDVISLVTNGQRRMFLHNNGAAIGSNNQFVVLESTGETIMQANSSRQLLIKPASTFAQDATLEIRGARNNTTNAYPSKIQFTNHDSDIGTSKNFGQIAGKVEDSTNNIGSIVFWNYNDGATSKETMKLTHDSRVLIDTTTNTYKLNVGGTGLFTADVSATNVNATTNVNTENVLAREVIGLGDLSFNKSGVISTTSSNIVLQPQGSDPSFGMVNIKGNLKVDGSINFIGDYIQTNTNVQVTEQLDVTNDGTGPALKVKQIGSADVAEFYDDNTKALIIQNGGNVGINTTSADEKLHVNGSIKVADGQSIYIGAGTGSGSERLRLYHDSTNSYIDYGTGKFHLRKSDNTSILSADAAGKIGIGTESPEVALHINHTDALKIPKGTTGERPTATGAAHQGYIRYNTELSSFEGFGAGNAWGSLGGVIDVDQDTYIKAENSANDDNDQLKFFTDGAQRMIVDASGKVGIGSETPANELDVVGTAHISSKLFTNDLSSQSLSVSNDSSFNSNLHVSGSVGIGTDVHPVKLTVYSSDAIRIPVGNTAQRPTATGAAHQGYIRYNTELSSFEGFGAGNAWGSLGGVKDVDQDTYITAETSAGTDNDELKFYTAGSEQMIIDASGDIGVGVVDPKAKMHINGSAIIENDISLNGTLTVDGDASFNGNVFISKQLVVVQDLSVNGNIVMPGGGGAATSGALLTGTTAERTDPAEAGMIRYNTDRNMAELYTSSNIWSGVASYKTEQPPLLVSISQNQQSAQVVVSWSKFPEIYKDAFSGRSYPVYLQTFVDISYNLLSGQQSNGWKTVHIGNGNYHTNGNSTPPLTSLTFVANGGRSYNNSTGYNLTFDNKPSTTSLPTFTQDDLFELRVYGVNNSGTAPIYIYITDVGLKQTGAPSAVVITNFKDVQKTEFKMDTSFYLDNNDQAITDGIDITNYDISFTLVNTRSKETVTDVGSQAKSDTNLDKSNILLTGLKPGSQYDVQIRAKNALNSDYGPYGIAYTSAYFTNDENVEDNTATRFINANDLNNVSPNGMEVTLVGKASINGHLNGTNGRSDRTLLSANNTNSSISLDGISSFYVNYGKQGTTLDNTTGSLVTSTFNMKNTSGTLAGQALNFTKTASQDTVNIGANGYEYSFQSAASYTDKGKAANYSKGYVYSSSFANTSGTNNNTIFNANFPASTDNYYFNYSIQSQAANNNQRIDKNEILSISRTTNNFYVDDYSSTPSVEFNAVPTISVQSNTFLFGVPSITMLKLTANYTISNFASHYIPYSDNHHSRVSTISKNGYTFSANDKTDVSQNSPYTMAYSKTSAFSADNYNADTSSNFTVNVFYLNNNGTPYVSTHTDNNKDVNNIGKVFRDSANTYNGNTLYFFNGVNTFSSAITTNSSNFATANSSHISNTLLYFDGKFVSGGYSTTYNGVTINAFSDWNNGFAVSGPNYSTHNNSGTGGFKWIAINVTNKRSNNSVDLSNFKICGNSPNRSLFGNSGNINGYEAYISHGSKFGALNTVFNSGDTAWFNLGDTTNISNAKTANGALQNNATDAYIDANTTSDIYLIVGLPQSLNSYFTFS